MSEIERESMPVDALFVGGGPACLAGAIHLMDLIEKHNAGVSDGSIEGDEIEEPMIALIEKGSDIGSHGISGAVLDPRALNELIPDWKKREDFPLERWVEREQMLMLTNATGGFALPFRISRTLGCSLSFCSRYCTSMPGSSQSVAARRPMHTWSPAML